MTVHDHRAASMTAETAFATVAALEAEVTKVIVGQQALIRRLLTALFAAIPFATARAPQARAGCGHALLEVVPRVAKTLTATTLGQAISAPFQPVPRTPDFLTSLILVTHVHRA